MPIISDSQGWIILAATLLVGWLLFLLAPILSPFFVALLLAYLSQPVVNRLQGKGLPRTAGAGLVLLLLAVLFVLVSLLLLPVIGPQIKRLVGALPQLVDWVALDALPWLNASFGLALEFPDAERIKSAFLGHVEQVGGLAVQVVGYVSQSGLALTGWLASMVVVPVVTFYMMRDWDDFVLNVRKLLPRGIEPTISALAGEVDEMLGAFLRGQLTVMLCLGGIYSVGLWLVGVEAALAIGLLSGLVSFVPYLGLIVGLLTASLAVLAQGPDLLQLAGVAVVFGVGQMLEGMVLTPWLVGDRVGLHPVAVIFSVLAGGQLFGFLGVLLALPTASILAVLLRYARARYRESDLYQEVERDERGLEPDAAVEDETTAPEG